MTIFLVVKENIQLFLCFLCIDTLKTLHSTEEKQSCRSQEKPNHDHDSNPKSLTVGHLCTAATIYRIQFNFNPEAFTSILHVGQNKINFLARLVTSITLSVTDTTSDSTPKIACSTKCTIFTWFGNATCLNTNCTIFRVG